MKKTLRHLVSFVLMVVVLGLTVPSAYAANSVTGNATRCSGLGTCSFTLSGSSGSGWASTYSSSVNFQLPGEAKATYNGVAHTTAVIVGYSSAAGTLYHVTGTFAATDANDGTIVTGSIDILEGLKSRSGRGGGNTWTLVSGSITIQTSTSRGSSTTIACSPSPLYTYANGTTTCTVTVADPGAGSASTPTGTIAFAQSPAATGTFSPADSCSLVSGACSVTFTLGPNAYYNVAINATYGGDGVHVSSSASQTIPIYSDD